LSGTSLFCENILALVLTPMRRGGTGAPVRIRARMRDFEIVQASQENLWRIELCSDFAVKSCIVLPGSFRGGIT
jgi:hypothetical protein